MKIDYESKKVLVSWREFGIFSKQTQQQLIGYSVPLKQIVDDVKKGKVGEIGNQEKVISYSGSGVCVTLKNENLTVEEFYNSIPAEVVAYEIDQDFLQALGCD